MLKWLLTVAIALALISALTPALGRLGLGRLPGDFRFRVGGRLIQIPLASTLVLSLLVGLVARLL